MARAPVTADEANVAVHGDVLVPVPRTDLYADAAIRSLEGRALIYLDAGIPVHFRGPAGTGKSTLAMQLAARIGRPVALLSGDGSVSARDLTGREGGTRSRQVTDRFIHNVHKQESETSSVWHDNALTLALQHGYTLFYDEFTRSPPAANNALLMALEERRLVVPGRIGRDSVIEAHPEFRAIFTSNPADYAGVEAPQDALIDRMITLDLSRHNAETEAGIVAHATGIALDDALGIVLVSRAARADDRYASLRPALVIARVAVSAKLAVDAADVGFVQLCLDVLYARWAEGAEGPTQRGFIAVIRSVLDEGAAACADAA